MSTPNPGSVAAQDLGCVCPIMDNSHGKGHNGKFFIHPECTVHQVELDPCPRCGELVTDDMGHSCREIPDTRPGPRMERTVRAAGWNARAAKAEAVAFGAWLLNHAIVDLEYLQYNMERIPQFYAEWKESQRGTPGNN